ncbi:hypothetical protein WJX72_002183 [[Myrmecia] bisecta]|uniref:ETFB lysine methyltransferase n=1 Tax=[Myrmecia] bisecta TaxID=41462 RepID=A0AAW1QB94_9CHLO
MAFALSLGRIARIACRAANTRPSCFSSPWPQQLRPAYAVCGAAGQDHGAGSVTQALAVASALESVGLPPSSIAALSESIQAQSEPCNLRCTIADVSGRDADAVAETLLSFGALSASVEEYRPPGATQQEIFDDGQTRKVWDRCTVVALFDTQHDVASTVRQVESTLCTGPLEFVLDSVADQEWEDAIKASYQPVQVCDGLWIVPDWCEPADEGAINIRMEPGLAFGTGEHATTRLCMRFLKSLDLEGKLLVDYGTGSGVLAIGALQMGAAFAAGTDTDPLSIKAATRNAALNGVDECFAVVQCQPTADGPDPFAKLPLPEAYDICVANILRGPLLELRRRLASYVKPGGTIALSGILVGQVPTVQAAYAEHFTDMRVTSDGAWALLTGTKKP